MKDLSCDVKKLKTPILFYLDVLCVMKSPGEIPVSFPIFARHNFEKKNDKNRSLFRQHHHFHWTYYFVTYIVFRMQCVPHFDIFSTFPHILSFLMIFYISFFVSKLTEKQ